VIVRLDAPSYPPAVAKRMLLDFQKGGYPSYDCVEEHGLPQPCALGVPWVNEDTLRTLLRLQIPRTDPWGRPLRESGSVLGDRERTQAGGAGRSPN
jgi:hypothetical protein